LLIRNCDLFSQLSLDELEELNLIHHFVEAKKGNYIYFETQWHDKLYFLKGGNIKIGYINNEGQTIIKEILQEGEIFGQYTLEKNNLSGEFAQAYKEDVSICAFTIKDFEHLLKNKPELSIGYSKLLGDKLRKVENRVVNLLYKDVKQRLADFLLQTATQQETITENNTATIELFFTQEDLARLIGASRQTVTTLLAELEKNGLISYNRQDMTIHNVKELQKISSVV
jgi:CRP/FNR family transcriptional regulator, cyclic AMP receptor protein